MICNENDAENRCLEINEQLSVSFHLPIMTHSPAVIYHGPMLLNLLTFVESMDEIISSYIGLIGSEDRHQYNDILEL